MNVSAVHRHWEQTVLNPALQRNPERQAEFATASGLPVDRLALPADVTDDYLEKLGFPGEAPFTRGVQPTMYRGRLWTMRQYAGFASAEESNRRYRFLIEQGTTGLSVAFDLPTQLGYDSDHALSLGEVGRVGVPVDSLADMEALFAGIPLDRISTSMTINASAAILLAMYSVAGEKQGAAARELSGTLQNDILKEYVARGTYIFPPHPSLRLATDAIVWCSRELPRFNPVSISGYHIREAGSTAVQELAFTFANACAYVDAAVARGLDVDDFAPRLSFFFNASSDFFEEIAKFRAARRLWARLMRDRFSAKKPVSQMLRFHAQTSGYSLAAQQIDNNVVRVTLQALAAVLGGAQSLHTNGRDEALALPSEEAARLALRTQQIIASESGVASTVDPLGGSFFVENLTDRVEADAAELIAKIDRIGGAVAAIESGFVERQIEDAAYRYQKEIEDGTRVIVGVNRYQESDPVIPPILKVDRAAAEAQCARLAAVRSKRDSRVVEAALSTLEAAAGTDANLMPDIVNAVRAYATVGEICFVLRRVFGEHAA